MLKRTFGMRLFLNISLAVSVAGLTLAQTPTQPAPGQPAQPATGPAAESISTTYREPRKDPFLDEEKLIKNKDKKSTIVEITVLPWPSYEEREAQWKERRDLVRSGKSGGPEPAPSERYLLDEVQVMGIFKKPDGQGVFIKPKPTANTMIFAAVGQKFYNGKISRIEGNQIEFEEISKLSNGKERVDKKTVRFTRGK